MNSFGLAVFGLVLDMALMYLAGWLIRDANLGFAMALITFVCYRVIGNVRN